MPGYRFKTMEEYDKWKLEEEYELANRSYRVLKGLYDNPKECFNWSDIQAIETAFFKQENKLRILKSKCISKGLVSLNN